MKDWKTPEVEKLIKAILLLRSEAELAAFLRDVCTQSELSEMGKRFAAAEMLHKSLPVRQIAEVTGLSTTTVSRVSHWKKYGEGGYDLVLDQLSPQK